MGRKWWSSYLIRRARDVQTFWLFFFYYYYYYYYYYYFLLCVGLFLDVSRFLRLLFYSFLWVLVYVSFLISCRRDFLILFFIKNNFGLISYVYLFIYFFISYVFLSFHFSIIFSFSILSLFHSSNQTNP